jgi:hypothetical protein
MQRARLQSQYECVNLRLHWSIVSLDPVFTASNTRHWAPDSYSAFHVSFTRILEIARGSVNSHARFLSHTDILYATTNLLQLLLRKVIPDRSQLDKYIVACRDGIAIGKSLIPDVLAKGEGIIEKLLNEYMLYNMSANCRYVSQLDNMMTMSSPNSQPSPPSDLPLPDNNYIYQLFEGPSHEETFFHSSYLT